MEQNFLTIVWEKHDYVRKKHDYVRKKHDYVREKHDYFSEKHDISRRRTTLLGDVYVWIGSFTATPFVRFHSKIINIHYIILLEFNITIVISQNLTNTEFLIIAVRMKILYSMSYWQVLAKLFIFLNIYCKI